MNLRPESLLAGHTVLHTRDAEALHAYIAGMEGCHERHVFGPGELEVELRHAALGRVDVGIVYHSVAITVEQSRKQSDSFLIQFPLSGRIDLDVDGQALMALPGKGAVISPSQHVRRTGQPGWTLAFRLAHDFVCQRLAHRLTRPLAGRLIFHPLINTAAAELCGFGLLVVEALDRGTAQAGGAVAQVLETGLVDLLLELQPHTLGRALAESGAALRSDRIQAVRDHLDRHLDEA
ncbi:MAG: hypothetical protein MUF48_21860, partial [Pirellulaceae bacterium]|nr:hypothetical protein [Pirellulaceae bacterium]